MQDATYYYTNVQPQWQVFNAGNWLGIEYSCRYYVEDLGVDLEVYTGVHSVMELDDKNGDKVEIYLNPDGSHTLPVPRYDMRGAYTLHRTIVW